MKVSQSRIKTWRRCRRAFYYKYGEGLRIKAPRRPLKFGSLMHRMFEFNKNGKRWSRAIDELSLDDLKLFESEREEYGDIVQNASDIMRSYVRHWKDDGIRYIRFNGSRAEHKIEWTIAKGINAVAIVDFLSESPNGRYWLGDHKTYNQELTDDTLYFSLQSSLYHVAWEVVGYPGIKLSGTLWDMVWSKPPSVPQVTQKGAVSSRAIVTLPSVVDRFQKEHRLDDEAVAELRDVANGCETRYFRRVYMMRDKRVERDLYEGFIETAKEIERRQFKDKARTIEKHCSWCEFRFICQAEMLGLDAQFVRRSKYVTDEDRKTELFDAASID
jgi:hypothetical protein